jgi:4a-hydroxytetrahydrobiopterin dehydratase
MKKEIKKEFVFADFAAAMVFVNKVAELAEAEGHHPDILIEYNKVTLTLSTHDVGGLTEKDFALEKKIDAIKL